MQLTNAVGLVGVLIYLGAYAALQFGIIAGQSYRYALLNIAAATCVLISLTAAFNLSSALIQICWIAISAGGIVRLYVILHGLRFTPEEADFIASKMPHLHKHRARKFLDNGIWVTGKPGTQLTQEEIPVDELIYMADGEADVTLGGHVIGQCVGGDYIGEITSLGGEPASATVTLTKPSRYFCIKASRVRELVCKTPELREALAVSFAAATGSKLSAINAELVRRGVGREATEDSR